MTWQTKLIGAVLLLLLLLMLAPAHAQVVPAEFVHDRIFVVTTAPDGTRVRFFTDTGGGWNAIGASMQQRLALAHTGDIEIDEARAPLVDGAVLFRRAGIPAPARDEPWLHGGLVVAPDGQLLEGNGTLGSRWFAGHIWDIDYPRQSMRIRKTPPAGLQDVPLGFAADESGKRRLNFPRVTIAVDGREFDVLLDTGASATLSPAAATVLGFEPGGHAGTSFVIRSIYERWQAAHPDWRTIPDGDTLHDRHFPMIEVPLVRIGAVEVGPVWFTQRPDPNFLEFMSSMTDRQVEGALGGSALKYLRVVLDYPGARLYLRKSAR